MEVDTVATDSHGKAVTDLRADQFRVFEDDHHRELAHFSFERVEKLDLHATERVRALAQHKSKLVYSNFAEDLSQVPLNGCTLLLADWLNTPLELQPQAQEQLKEFIRTADLAKPLAIYALDRSLHLIPGLHHGPHRPAFKHREIGNSYGQSPSRRSEPVDLWTRPGRTGVCNEPLWL